MDFMDCHESLITTRTRLLWYDGHLSYLAYSRVITVLRGCQSWLVACQLIINTRTRMFPNWRYHIHKLRWTRLPTLNRTSAACFDRAGTAPTWTSHQFHPCLSRLMSIQLFARTLQDDWHTLSYIHILIDIHISCIQEFRLNWNIP